VLRWCVVNCVRVWARSVSCTESMSGADGLLASQAEYDDDDIICVQLLDLSIFVYCVRLGFEIFLCSISACRHHRLCRIQLFDIAIV